LGWARCLPSENHCKGENEWNHYRVEANDGVIKLEVNGHVVSGVSKCNPRKGYLALESEGSECHFRNLKIKELPSTNPKKSEIADEATGFKTLYTGLDLSGWKADEDTKKHWKANDTELRYDGKGNVLERTLATEKEYGGAEFIVDFRFPKDSQDPCAFLLRQEKDVKVAMNPDGRMSWTAGSAGGHIDTFVNPAGSWNRLRVTVTQDAWKVMVNDKQVHGGERAGLPAKGAFILSPQGEMDFANLFVRELK
jgi:hypothetical protein